MTNTFLKKSGSFYLLRTLALLCLVALVNVLIYAPKIEFSNAVSLAPFGLFTLEKIGLSLCAFGLCALFYTLSNEAKALNQS